MIRRVFSRETYNGYHLVSLKGEGEDDSPVGFFKRLTERDEHGYLADPDDMPECPHRGQVNLMGSPWDVWLYVPSLCQKCVWVYRDPQENNHDCLLKTRAKVSNRCLVVGGA